jgi:hypothetical protein
MNKKVVSKPNKPMNKAVEPITRDKQRGVGVVGLLFTVTTLGAAALVAAMHSPKLPPIQGD